MRRSLFVCSLAFAPCASLVAQRAATEWPAAGGDRGGARFSPLRQITRDNVKSLVAAWTFHTGEAPMQVERGSAPSLEVTPLMVDGTLYLSTPRGQVIALDAATGAARWRYDASVTLDGGYGDFANRGVSMWLDPRAPRGAPCRRRLFFATIDARLLALDAATGRLCDGFGTRGAIDLRQGLRIPPYEFPAYEVTSPPAIVNGLVITGSAISDNGTTRPASGEIRAFDARTGRQVWRWDPIPQDAKDPAAAGWRDGAAARTGGANAWSMLVADSARDLVFVPTTSPAPDYFGGLRLGDNRYANSVVALRASTGALVWHFQTVHHDLWDYDNASPPLLTSVVRGGRHVDVVVQATKTGMLFVLDRVTGAPIFPVEERAVPASDVADEEASPTQPFGIALSPHRFSVDSVWGLSDADRAACRAMLDGVRNDGIFTPPSRRGTLAMPSNIGGAHWGGAAADADRQLLVVPVNRIAAIVQLIPNAEFAPERMSDADRRMGYEYTRMRGTPYGMRRRLFIGEGGLPCTPPPFGSLVAVDLRTGTIRWNVPLGTIPLPNGASLPGSPNLGGPIMTAGGLTFVAATLDRALRAFDSETGAELWKGDLPAGGKATPMTYAIGGRQFVVIAAGGGGRFGDGDAIVAYALPLAAGRGR